MRLKLFPVVQASSKFSHLPPVTADPCFQHLISTGAKKIACIGICWGGWAMAHLTSDPEMAPHFACAASPHPSITLEESVYGGSTLDLVQSIRCPTLLMPASGDPDDYRAGSPKLWGLVCHPINAIQVDRCFLHFLQALPPSTSPRCNMVFSTVEMHQNLKFPLKLLAQSLNFFRLLLVFDSFGFLFQSIAMVQAFYVDCTN